MRLLLLTAVSLALIAGTLSQESEVQALPAELNKMFVLPCQQPVTEDKSCAWMHGSKLINNLNVKLYPGYKFIGDLDTGDCRLEIASVKIEDDGVWKCSKLSSTEGFTVNVIVLATPSENYLQYRVKGDTESKPLDKTPVMVQAEETYEVDCISQNGRPAVISIEWFVNNNFVDNANPPDIQSDDGLFTVKSTYELSFQTPDAYRLEGPDDKEKEITCVIYHIGFPEGKHELTATFGEKYKTTQVTIRDAKGPGGKSGNIICDGDGIPEPNYEIQIHKENDMWETVYYSQRGNVTTPGIYRCAAIYFNPDNQQTELPPVFSQHYDYTSATYVLRYNGEELKNNSVLHVQNGSTISQLAKPLEQRPKVDIAWKGKGITEDDYFDNLNAQTPDGTYAPLESYLGYRLNKKEDYQKLINEAVVLVEPGDVVDLECVSNKRNPTKIQWYIDDYILKEKDEEELGSDPNEENSALHKSRSTLQYIFPLDDTCHTDKSRKLETKITCVIHHTNFSSGVNKISAKFGKKYKPTWVEIDFDEDADEETGSVICKADGIPEPAFEIQLLEDDDTWTTVNCGRKGVVAKSGLYRCAARYVDPITKQNDTVTSKLFYEHDGKTPSANYLKYVLNNYGDFARLRNDAVIVVRPDDQIRFRCVSENGRTKPTEIQWYEDGIFQRADKREQLYSESAEYDTKEFTVWSSYNLTIPFRNAHSTYNGARNYEKIVTCAIYHNGFKEDVKKITTTIGEKYKTTRVETRYIESDGEDRKTGNIHCTADGIPEPTYEIQSHDFQDVWVAIHLGRNITITQPGSYRCVATYTDPDSHQNEEPIPSKFVYRREAIKPFFN